jgi:hypothetical protein
MAERKAAGLSGRIELGGADQRGERPALAVHALSADGQVIATAKVGADGRFTVPQAALEKAARVVIGDASADPSAEGQRFIGYRVDEAREIFKGEVLHLPEDYWDQLYWRFQCVSGNVRRCFPYRPLVEYLQASASTAKLSSIATKTRNANLIDISVIDAATVFHPYRCATICQGLVEVYRRTCCCEPPIIFDPGEVIDGPVIDWPPPWPPPEDPWDPWPPEPPGPFPVPPGPGPDPAPLELLDQVASGGALDTRKINAQRDTFALQNLKGSRLSEYIKLRPYLWCTCGAGTKVAEGLIADDGSFSICWRDFPRFLLPGCSDEYAYRVKQVIDGVTVTVYDGPAAGQWFGANANPTLTSYSRTAVSCIGDPVIPGAGPAIVLLHEIGSTESHHLGTPSQASPDSVNALAFNSGLIDPAATDGPSVNRPLGGTLGLRYFFSRGMQPLARFFRVDVAGTDDTGAPTSAWAPVPVPAWSSWKWVSGTGFIRAQHSLGPNAAGQYVIPFGTGAPLAAFEEWDPDQFHALLDTTAHPDGKYLVRIQVFDAAGNQIKPTGATGSGTARPFTFGRWRIPAGPPDNVPFSALTHAFWWDNRPAAAHIEGVRLSSAMGSPTCQFLKAPPGAGVSIDFRAYHPHPIVPASPSFLQGYSLSVTKGIGGGTPLSVGGSTEQGKPPGPAAVQGTTVGALLGATKRCSFAVSLSAAVKTTNGGGRLSYLDRSDVAAFAAEQT